MNGLLMSQTARKLYLIPLAIFGIIGLAVLLLFGQAKKNPQSVIKELLWELGISEPTIKFWTAVSALETDFWKSRVFKDSNNLFCIIVPGSKRLQYGEGQTIFANIEDSIIGPEGLYKRVLKPFKYPAHVQSLDELVSAMKQRGYFTSDAKAYLQRLKQVYTQLYPND